MINETENIHIYIYIKTPNKRNNFTINQDKKE